MNLRLVVEHDAATNRWAAFFPELPGCASAGDTEEEAIRNAREALWTEHTERDAARATFEAELAALQAATETERRQWSDTRNSSGAYRLTSWASDLKLAL